MTILFRSRKSTHLSVRGRRTERGSVSTEFALASPILILTALSGIFVLNVLSTRQQLTAASNQAVRLCSDLPSTMPRGPSGYANCIRGVISNQLRNAGMNNRCNLQVRSNILDAGGGRPAMLISNVTCRYQGTGSGLIENLVQFSRLLGGGGGYTRDQLTPTLNVETAFPL